jgi:diadenosine tetraphosphate (Ap4A) HIT family hydrolase
MNFPLPEMDPCYFCEIIEGRAEQWNIIEHNDMTVTMLNGRQFEVGQCVVLPVRHAPTLLDLTRQEASAVMSAAKRLTRVMVREFAPEASAVMSAAKRLTRVMVREFAPDGVLLYQNNGTGSGQEVPHFHLHVIPRRPGSDWGLGPPHIARVEQGQRPAHIDFEAITDTKRQTVEGLRRHFE